MNLHNVKIWPPVAFIVVVALAALVLPQFANRGTVFLVGVVALNAVFGTAFNFAFSKAGILSFGHAMFFAVGAYAAGYLIINQPTLPFSVILLVAAALGALLAAIAGLVALRRASGVAFAVITLALGELIHVLITKLDFLGRNDGMTGVVRPKIGFGALSIDLSVGNNYYYFIILASALLLMLMWALWSNAFGRTLHAVKDDPMRAAFLGINIHSQRVKALAISGAVSALAGAMFAPWAQIVSPDVAMWTKSTMPLLYALLGGMAFYFGPFVGAILFGILEYNTRTLVGVSELIAGGVLLAAVLAVPGGVLGAIRTIGRRLRPAAPVPAAPVQGEAIQ